MEKSQQKQNVVVMRHGDRIDHAEPLWTKTADRPWDPPLIEAGKLRAYSTASKFAGFPIQRVIVSPFIRCVQTASSAISALQINRPDVNIKVSIEYGLCEMLNSKAIPVEVAPKDGKFSFNIAELEAMFPAGTVDHSVEPVYKELPKWEETVSETRTRYIQIVKSLADKYPTENLLLVTHAEGVGVALTAFMKDITVYEVEYCANVHLRREISMGEGKSFTAGDFEVVRPITGMSLVPLSTTAGGPLA